jgi:hypothetical protein
MGRRLSLIVYMLMLIVLGACQSSKPGTGEFTVTVVVGNDPPAVYRYDKAISVGQFLEKIGVVLNDLDEVNPPVYTQLRDGMRITVSRVVERTDCKEDVLPYETERQFTQALPPGQQQIAQTGENGVVQICYRITEKNGVEVGRAEISRIPIKEPRNEIVYIGSEPPETLVPVEGVLTYISGGQAWIIEGNAAQMRPLTTNGHLDSRVFELSQTGRQLLYTQSTKDTTDPEFSNELWAILDTSGGSQAVQLVPSDVRYAQWVPGRPYTVSYSTADPTTDVPGWQAYNDLYLMQLDSESGQTVTVDELIPQNALGVYAYWGRRYIWSPDGTQLAWALADSVGLVDLEAKKPEFTTLLTFPEYATALTNSWVWIPKPSWSEDGHLITTIHGTPYGAESPEDSIIFDLAVLDTNSTLQITHFFSETGIWACPTYSPMLQEPDGSPNYWIAYFQAREPLNSPGSQYDLVIADSDGSNPRVLFPGPDKPGISRPDPEDGIAWSPMARQIAVIYQGNLWIIDIQTGLSHQITSDGQASRPRWAGRRSE